MTSQAPRYSVNPVEAYVIFGTQNPTDFGTEFQLSSLDGDNGFTIQAAQAGDQLGERVAAVGDLNGDDVDDLLVTAPQGNTGGSGLGEAYVVYGKKKSEEHL